MLVQPERTRETILRHSHARMLADNLKAPRAAFIAGTQARIRGDTSAEMKLLLVLLLLTDVLALNYYNGFNDCGQDGWSCSTSDSNKGIITYDCSESLNPSARIWLWTARLPSDTDQLIVQNCSDLELHVDCTRGHRSYEIETLKLINIHTLTILQPSLAGQELHDNAEVYHLPPSFHMENIAFTKLRPGMFDDAPTHCNYHYKRLETFTASNVNVGVLQRGLFNNTLTAFHWSNVTVAKMEGGSLRVTGNATFENCSFPDVPHTGMHFSGPRITFSGNRIGKIYPNAISAYSYEFNFNGNDIRYLMTSGLELLSSHVSIEGNKFHHLAEAALSDISPTYYPLERKPSYGVTYSFVRNSIQLLSPSSLHNNWESYNSSCSKVVIENNTFSCSCDNLNWIQSPAVKSKNIKPFYDVFLNSTNLCYGAANCTVSDVLAQVCNGKKSTGNKCVGLTLDEPSDAEEDADPQQATLEGVDEEPPAHEKREPQEIGNPETMGEGPHFLAESYYQDHSRSTDDDKSLGVLTVWVTVLAVLLSLVVLSVLAFLLYVRRKRKATHQVNDMYKYEKNGDSDKLMKYISVDAPNSELENIGFEN